MPLNKDYIGREYASGDVYEVGREHLRQFADAIGDTNPVYRDPEAAKAAGHPDVIAPPTFLTVLGFRFAGGGPMADPGLGVDYSKLVHGEQKFVAHRPVRAGDRLTATMRIADIRAVGRNEIMSTVTDVSTVDGEPVAALTSTVVIRGTAPQTEA